MIVTEDLKVSNMFNRKRYDRTAWTERKSWGLVLKPLNTGAGLAGEMRRQLEYKAAWRGGQVPGAPSTPPVQSQRACCGHTAKRKRHRAGKSPGGKSSL